MNLEMFKRVRDQVAFAPQQVDMDNVVKTETCGTVGCIAGWAMLLEGKVPLQDLLSGTYSDYVEEGARILNIHEREAHRLFHANQWPEEYKAQFWSEEDVPDYNEGLWYDSRSYREETERQLRDHNSAVVVSLLDEIITRQDIWWVGSDDE